MMTSLCARRFLASAGGVGLLSWTSKSWCDEQLVHVPSSMTLKLAGVIAEDSLAAAQGAKMHPLAVVVLDAGGCVGLQVGPGATRIA